MNDSLEKLSKTLGPGLMFAAVCIGVSHIVQATRSGAEFGMSILPLALFVVLLKYPAFRFAPQYTLGTGMSLLQGYRNIGRWAVVIYALISFSIMCIVLAAVSMVTSGVLQGYYEIDLPIWVLSFLLMGICIATIVFGGYKYLEQVTKALIIVFSFITLIATIIILTKVKLNSFAILPNKLDVASIAFIVAFIGWLPSGVGSSVWQSMWMIEKAKPNKDKIPEEMKYYVYDFNIGYIAAALSIVCFVILGAALMFENDAQFSSNSSTFILEIIGLYEEAIGAWCRPIVALGAFAVLFSTLIGSIDGFPRTNAQVYRSLIRDETPWDPQPISKGLSYNLFMLFGCGGALLIQSLWIGNFTSLIDFAVTLSFLTAPIVATLNHIAINSPIVEDHAKPTRRQNIHSILCILLFGASSIGYVLFIM